MKLCIASGNANKISEMRQILGGVFRSVVSADELGIDMAAVEETGATFEENALLKAQYLFDKTGCPSLADDSGLCVDALNGAPGIHSARYAGSHGDSKANNLLLLKNLQGAVDRRAHFACAVVLVMPGGNVFTGNGRVYGSILYSAEGDAGFGYDPLFFCTEIGTSFGLCSSTLKNSVSHRKRALEDLLKKINGA